MRRPVFPERKLNLCNDRKGGTIGDKNNMRGPVISERKINVCNDRKGGTIVDKKHEKARISRT